MYKVYMLAILIFGREKLMSEGILKRIMMHFRPSSNDNEQTHRTRIQDEAYRQRISGR